MLHSHRHPIAANLCWTGASVKSKYKSAFIFIKSFISGISREEKEVTFNVNMNASARYHMVQNDCRLFPSLILKLDCDKILVSSTTGKTVHLNTI